MPVSVQIHNNFSVIVASLCGALAWAMNQRYFDRKKQPVTFLISFAMGILGADATLEIINALFPGVFFSEKAIGAFFCSALIITFITKIIYRVRGQYEENNS